MYSNLKTDQSIRISETMFDKKKEDFEQDLRHNYSYNHDCESWR